ncbi:universal stress protein [Phytopseudomonas dryadis]|uniref:Universal stress protein UspA n=1 Tax=Phytopseudomonas dryadis TaxID=2487520 RepID=A0A4Q9QY18_9GAMM|nr:MULTISPECIES: universal stress protein [Pseudomonas]TBU89707.1 universal stress protein UspA [Pseudomonas dryadis]TBV06022.1 universal stress protein UspA [Pseudomonas dryadis]TBV18163.1 universal stress protein UspA [Pseudomonas sp. FRB 230]
MQLEQLLVVIDANQPSHPALERAAWLARRTSASLHVLLVEYSAALDGSLLENSLQNKAREALLEQRGKWLQDLLTPLRDEGLPLQQDVRWGKRLHETVLEKVAELQPDLVLKSAAHNNLLRRLLLTDSCWQLMRHCPAPLWLVHHAEWRGHNLCTAVDPLHQDDKPAALDHHLIQTAQGLATTLDLHADYVHCHAPLPRALLSNVELLADYQQYIADEAAQHHQAFERLIRQYDIAADAAHLLEGAPENVLPRFVRKQEIDLLVMGCIARGRLDTILIGHTAERLLESVDCDLLVVKMPAKSSAEEQ